MARADKREQKIRDNPRNVSLVEFEELIRRHGELEAGGNHAIVSIGNIRYPFKRQNPVNHHYVAELLRIIDAQTGGDI